MRKHIPLALAAFVLLSCQKGTVSQPRPEQPVTKTVTFQVFAVKDYSHAYYANTTAVVNLGISAIDRRTGATTTVWDTTFTRRSVNLYPQHSDMYVVEKSLPVYESTHSLNAGYWVRYDTDGMISQEGMGEGLSQGVKTLRVEVTL